MKSDKKKEIKISIGTELISMISLILLVSLSAMIFLATYFFKTDSETRIKENSHKLSEVLSQKVRSDFLTIVEGSRNLAEQIYEAGRSRAALNDILAGRFFGREKDIIYICTAERDAAGRLRINKSAANSDFIKRNNITAEKINSAIYAESKLFSSSFDTLYAVHNLSLHFELPVVGISAPFVRKTETAASSILIIVMSMNRFLEAVRSTDITEIFIVNSDGDIIAHNNKSLVRSRINLKKLPIVKMMMTNPANNIQTRYSDEAGTYFIGSYYKVGFAGSGVIVSVEEDKAFRAVYRIQKRNFLITVIVLCLSIIIVYVFSKTIIRPIKSLVEATREIEAGRFNITMGRQPGNELGLLMTSFRQMGQGLAERERMKDAFSKFVNPEIAEMVLRDGVKLGGERKKAAVFFSDIRSFTAISEKLQPEEVVEFLNDYMSRMVDCVNRTHGVVDKFIGDAIMAVWGAPVSYGSDTENAIECALLMRKSLIEFNKGRGSAKKPAIIIGCGINTGPVLAGQIGSQEKMEYTVIGDAVNLASRIESLNKPFGTDILISEESYNLVKNVFAVEKMQEIRVKGKEKNQTVYTVLGRKDDPECPKSVDQVREMLGLTGADLSRFDSDWNEVKFEIVGSRRAQGKKGSKA